MHGHRSIIAARLAGRKPGIIFFDIDLRTAPPRYTFEDAEHALETGQYAHVELSLSEKWRLLDLRFVTGCHACVSALRWSKALHAFAKKLAAHGATKILVGCQEGGPLLQFTEGTWHVHH